MDRNITSHLLLILICCLYALPNYSQTITPLPKLEIINSIVPQKQNKKTIDDFLCNEMINLVNYSNGIIDPSIRDFSTDKFLEKYYPKYEKFLMKNGDIAYLKFYYKKFLRAQTEFKQLADSQQVKYELTRKDFFKKSNLPTRKEKRKYWRKFDSKRKQLIDHFLAYHHHIIPAISTELAMMAQQDHLPALCQAMNNLTNLDNSPLDVYIYSNYQLSIPHKHQRGRPIAGLSIISKCNDIFTSGSPAVRDTYPGLRGNNKGLAVHLKLFEGGVTLSHELGHLYYLYYRWEDYLNYIAEKGKDYEPGGHGPGDPSGLAARMTENGVMPFEVPEDKNKPANNNQTVELTNN